MFYIGFLFKKNEKFAYSLIFGERCERIAQVSHQKWAMWANRSGRSPKMSEWANRSFFWENRSFAHFLQNTSDSLRKPMSEFPALQNIGIQGDKRPTHYTIKRCVSSEIRGGHTTLLNYMDPRI